MKLTLLALFGVALACAAEPREAPGNHQPLPRQLFRDGGGQFLPRRPTLRELRERREKFSIGEQPLGSEPVFDSSDLALEDVDPFPFSSENIEPPFARGKDEESFPQEKVDPDFEHEDGVDSENLFDLGAFSTPNLPFPARVGLGNPQEDKNGFLFEENTDELPEYIRNREEHSTEDDAENDFARDRNDVETRSPAHRYPDEETTPGTTDETDDQLQTSATTGESHVTTVPLVEDDFNPFALFESDKPEQPEEGPTHREAPEEEQDRERDTPRGRGPPPNGRRRFRVRTPAQERNFDTRQTTRSADSRPAPFNLRAAAQRHPSRPQTSQPLLQNLNLIQRNPFFERQQLQRQQQQQQQFQHQQQQQVQQDQEQQQQYQQQQQQRPRRPPPQQRHPPEYSNTVASHDYPEYEDDEDKPDRLSELLLQSKFSCKARKDGYYADEDVNCEVFHFCQDGVKHSWLCPNNAAFHQVHLICMPHSEDNICERSSKFHFVNDFLYKEVGEHPENRSYVERYYPQGYEGGVANIPDRDGSVPPQAEQPVKYFRPSRGGERPAPPPDYSRRPQNFPRREEVRHPEEQQPQIFERRLPTRHRQGPPRHELGDPSPAGQGSVNRQAYQPQALKNSFSDERKKPQLVDADKEFKFNRPKFEAERPRPNKQRPEYQEVRPQPPQPEVQRPHSGEFHPPQDRPQFLQNLHQQQARPEHRPDIPHRQSQVVRLQPEILHQQPERHRQQPNRPQHQPERPRIPERAKPEPFRQIVGSDPVYESLQLERGSPFEIHRPSPEQGLGPQQLEHPSSHVQHHQGLPLEEPQFHLDREQRPSGGPQIQRRPSFVPHEPPVYHPQQPFFRPSARNNHAAPSSNIQQIRHPDGHRPLIHREAQASPLPFHV